MARRIRKVATYNPDPGLVVDLTRFRWPYHKDAKKRTVQNEHGGQTLLDGRAFAPPRDIPVIRWTSKWQGWCIDNGFFLERDDADCERVIVWPIIPHYLEFKSASDVMTALVKAATDGKDPFAVLVLDFIKQQDEYGYSGMWEVSRDKYWGLGRHLRWYNDSRRHNYDCYLMRWEEPTFKINPETGLEEINQKIDGRSRYITSALAKERVRANSVKNRPSAANLERLNESPTAAAFKARLARINQMYPKGHHLT